MLTTDSIFTPAERLVHELLADASTDEDDAEILRLLQAFVRSNDDDSALLTFAAKRDVCGRTLLTKAVLANRKRIVDRLLETKGELFIGDALTHAVDRGHYFVASAILEFAAARAKLTDKRATVRRRRSNDVYIGEPTFSEWSCQVELVTLGHRECRVKKICTTAAEVWFHLLEEDDVTGEGSAFFGAESVANPLIHACHVDDYEMIHLLLQWGFVVLDPDRFDHDATFLADDLALLKALCSPSLVNLTETESTLRCLDLAERLAAVAKVDIEFAEDYAALSGRCQGYAETLLRVCRHDDPEELDAILGVARGAKSAQIRRALSGGHIGFYTQEKCYRFVEKLWHRDRDFYRFNATTCDALAQFVFNLALLPVSPFLFFDHEMKKGEETRTISTRVSVISATTRPPSWREKIAAWWRTRSSPRSSFLHYLQVYFIFLIVISSEVFKENRRNMTQFGCPLDKTEIWILVFVLGATVHLAEHASLQRLAFFKNFWNVYGISNITFFLLAYAIWFFGYTRHNIWLAITPNTRCGSRKRIVNEVDESLWPSASYVEMLQKMKTERNNSSIDPTVPSCFLFNSTTPTTLACHSAIHSKMGSRVYWTDNENFLVVSEIFFMLGTVAILGRLSQLCQIHKQLGLMQLMLFKTTKHVALFFFVFFMYLFCFTAAIQMIYVNYRGMWQIVLDPLTRLPVCQEMSSHFPEFLRTLGLLFWDLFGYGDDETTEIFLPNIRLPKASASAPDVYLDPETMMEFRHALCAAEVTRDAFVEIMSRPPLNYSVEDVNNAFNFAPHRPHIAEGVASVVLSIYHVFAVIVLLNLLIALMTNVFKRIDDSANVQWKASKTRLRLRYIGMGYVVPPPFNLLSYALRWTRALIMACRRAKAGGPGERELFHLKRHKKREIQNRLHRRVMNLKKERMENGEDPD